MSSNSESCCLEVTAGEEIRENIPEETALRYSSTPDMISLQKNLSSVCKALDNSGSLSKCYSEPDLKSTNLNEHALDLCMHAVGNSRTAEEMPCHTVISMEGSIEDSEKVVDMVTCKKITRYFDSRDAGTDKTVRRDSEVHVVFNELHDENYENSRGNSDGDDAAGLCCGHVALERLRTETENQAEGSENQGDKNQETRTENDDFRGGKASDDEQETETSKSKSKNKDRLSTASDSSIEVHCRICHCGGEDEKLISPCSCAGSLQHIHESCLVQWMKSKMMDTCELCQAKIEIRRRIKPFWRWQRPLQRPYPLIWLLAFIAAIILNVASVAKDASSHCTSTPCVVFYIVGCLGAVLASVFMIYFAKRAKDFVKHWVRINEDWVILDRRPNNVSKRKPRHNDNDNKKQLILFSQGLNTRV